MNEAKQMQNDLGAGTVVRLKYPVRLATGRLLEEVTVRRPRVGDLRAVAHIAGEAEQGLALVARVSGLVPEDLDELDLSDLNALQDVFRDKEDK